LSRVVNVKATVEAVSSLCDKHGIAISTIEPLESGGTRVVLKSAEGTREFRRRMSSEAFEGPTTRSGLYMARPPLPNESGATQVLVRPNDRLARKRP
jgi:hypothetical protein